MSGSNNSAAARNARCAQRGDTREQQEQENVETREDPEIISVDDAEVEVQAPPADGNQLKVLVHNVDVDEMSAVEYTAAVIRLIAVNDTEVKNSARTIAQHQRKMESEMIEMWDIIQSADRSTNPAIKERIEELKEGGAKVDAARGDRGHNQDCQRTSYGPGADRHGGHSDEDVITDGSTHKEHEAAEEAVPGTIGEVREGQLHSCYGNAANKELEHELMEQLVEGRSVTETNAAQQGRHPL